MVPIDHPFAPGERPSREEMIDHVRGRGTEEQRHRIERYAAADPLFRDALDGLKEPGSLEAMEKLVSSNEPGGSRSKGSRGPVVAGIVVVFVLGVIWWIKSGNQSVVEPPPSASIAPIDVDPAPVGPEARKAFEAEAASAHPMPATMISASIEEEHFKGRSKDAQLSVREDGPGKLKPREGDHERTVPPGKLTNEQRSTHQLVFLHDMKLIDPAELYPSEQLVLDTRSVDARFERQGQEVEEERTGMPYLEFMDQAMSKYAAADRKGCLEQLFLLLAEKPDDVNALFYAGLCSYDIGLFQRAAGYFQRVRQSPIDTFDEEAEWYQALTQEQLVGREGVKPLYQRIAQRGGFYAARADLKLQE